MGTMTEAEEVRYAELLDLIHQDEVRLKKARKDLKSAITRGTSTIQFHFDNIAALEEHKAGLVHEKVSIEYTAFHRK